MNADFAIELLEHPRGLFGAIQQLLDNEESLREIARSYADGEAFLFMALSRK